MARTRIRKGDTVQVISGAAAGRTGKVMAVYPDTQRLLVEGINRVKRHTKVGTTGRGGKTGGIITQEAPIHLSNVMLVDPDTKKPTRIGVRVDTIDRDGRAKPVRVRVAKRSGKDV